MARSPFYTFLNSSCIFVEDCWCEINDGRFDVNWVVENRSKVDFWNVLFQYIRRVVRLEQKIMSWSAMWFAYTLKSDLVSLDSSNLLKLMMYQLSLSMSCVKPNVSSVDLNFSLKGLLKSSGIKISVLGLTTSVNCFSKAS